MTRPSRLLALGAALVVAGAVAVATPAVIAAPAGAAIGTGTGSAGQTLTVTPADDLDPAGETVTVTGSGFDADAGFDTATEGLYVAFCVDAGAGVAPSPCVGGADMTGGSGASRWVTNAPFPGTPSVAITADGSFTTTIVVQRADDDVDCAALPAGQQCKVVVRMDHRASGDRSQDVKVPVTFGPGSAEPEPEPEPEPGTAGPTTTSLIVAPTTVAVGTPIVATASVRTNEATADSTDGARSHRAAVTTGTVELFDGSTSLGTATLGPDGRATRTATFSTAGAHPVTARFTGTSGAGASTSAAVVVTVTAPVDPDPDPGPDPLPTGETPNGTRSGTGPNGQILTATPVDDLDPAGTSVEVRGSGYTGAAGFDVDTDGLYVSFCVDRGAGIQPSPCIGGVDMEGESGSSAWVTNTPYQGAPATPVAADGSFTARITVAARDEFVDCLDLPAGQRCVIVSRMDHRATADRSQDVKVPVCFVGEAACATEEIDPTTPPGGTTPFAGYPLPVPASSTPLATPGALAVTGFSGRTLVPAGLALVGLGTALVLITRRRSATT